MRKVLFGILMAATAATPIAAQAQDSDGGNARAEARAQVRAERAQEHYERAGERNQQRFEQRQERVEQRQERVEQRQERVERVERQQVYTPPVQQAPAAQRQDRQGSWAGRQGGDSQRGSWSGRQSGDSQRGSWSGRNSDEREALQRQIDESREASRRSADQTIGGNYARQADRNQQRYEDRLRDRNGDQRRGDWNRDRDGRDGRYGDGRYGRNDDGRHDRDGSRWSDRNGHRDWNRDWRRDSRYDWQRYRYSNRNIFRSGGYYAPYRGYSYRRLSIGLFLDSLFYSNRYWIGDPWQYRLPQAPYGTQWVRYYDDVLLVDVYTGEVVDVIYDFFW